MRGKRLALIFLAVIVGLPVLLIVGAVVSYEVVDRSSGTLLVAGETREYLLHVPESHDPATPAPLVISLHGSSLWPAMQMAMSGWNRVADEEGFIVVYPSGFPLVGGKWFKLWRLWPGLTGSDDTAVEVQFISDLIDALEAQYKIDPTRIYADGYSGGGGMANLLACRLPDRFAAIGAVAAARLTWDRCDAFEPTPLIAFQGTADELGPYEGGASTHWAAPPGATWDSVAVWTAGWAQRNGCGASHVESVEAADVKRLAYADCKSGADVVLYTIQGGGHSWPGHPGPKWLVGRTTDSIDATREIWAFFREHRLAVN